MKKLDCVSRKTEHIGEIHHQITLNIPNTYVFLSLQFTPGFFEETHLKIYNQVVTITETGPQKTIFICAELARNSTRQYPE